MSDYKSYFERMVFNSGTGSSRFAPALPKKLLQGQEVVVDMRTYGVSENQIRESVGNGSGIVKAERYTDSAANERRWEIIVREGRFGDIVKNVTVVAPIETIKETKNQELTIKKSSKKALDETIKNSIGELVEETFFATHPIAMQTIKINDSVSARKIHSEFDKFDTQLRKIGWSAIMTDNYRWNVFPSHEVSFNEGEALGQKGASITSPGWEKSKRDTEHHASNDPDKGGDLPSCDSEGSKSVSGEPLGQKGSEITAPGWKKSKRDTEHHAAKNPDGTGGIPNKKANPARESDKVLEGSDEALGQKGADIAPPGWTKSKRDTKHHAASDPDKGGDLPNVKALNLKCLTETFGEEIANVIFKGFEESLSEGISASGVLSALNHAIEVLGEGEIRTVGGKNGMTFIDLQDAFNETIIFDHTEKDFKIGFWGEIAESQPERFPEAFDEEGNLVAEASARTRAANNYGTKLYPKSHYLARSTDAANKANLRDEGSETKDGGNETLKNGKKFLDDAEKDNEIANTKESKNYRTFKK